MNHEETVLSILLAEEDAEVFGGTGGAEEPAVVWLDGEFAVAAVDEDGEFDAGGAADVEEAVDGGADGAAGVEDVVDEDDVAVGGGEGDVGAAGGVGDIEIARVVVVERDVERADGDVRAFGFEDAGDAAGEGDPAAVDADEDEVGARVIFEDLEGEPVDADVEFASAEEARALRFHGEGG